MKAISIFLLVARLIGLELTGQALAQPGVFPAEETGVSRAQPSPGAPKEGKAETRPIQGHRDIPSSRDTSYGGDKCAWTKTQELVPYGCPPAARSIIALAEHLDSQGRHSESVPLWEEAERILWVLLTQHFSELTLEEKRRFQQQADFRERSRLWSLAFEQQAVGGEVMLQSCLRRKQLFTEAARVEHAARMLAAGAAAPAWRAQWAEYRELQRDYVRLALPGYEEADANNRFDAQQVPALAGKIAVLDARLRQNNTDYTRAARIDDLTPADIRAALRPTEALVEYVIYESFHRLATTNGPTRYGALVVRGGEIPIRMLDLGPASLIDGAVRSYTSGVREQIQAWKNPAPTKPVLRAAALANARASAALRQQVWDPLESYLAGATRVYLGPAGPLCLLPFEALAREHPTGWRYLVEERELVYLGSSRDLARLALTTSAVRTNRTAMLVGNPDFDWNPAWPGPAGVEPKRGHELAGMPALGNWENLPRWERIPELDGLLRSAARRFLSHGWTVTTLTNQQALKRSVVEVDRPRLLQFATHGQMVGPAAANPGEPVWDNPLLRSRLILAGANKRGSHAAWVDGVLTAYEAATLNLHGTELVNLMACETGLGEVSADGVAGLRQACWVAGARAVTASLWEVPAGETARQVAEFYEQWLGGAEPTCYRAFRGAQLAALGRARTGNVLGAAHPFFWAGLTYFGDPGDLPAVRKSEPTHPTAPLERALKEPARDPGIPCGDGCHKDRGGPYWSVASHGGSQKQ